MSASTRARQLSPEVFCQAMRPLDDSLQMPISHRRRRLRGVARHGAGAWWDDDGRYGVARGNLAMDVLLIVSTVSRERSNRTMYLIEQGADLGRVIDIAGGQRRGRDPSGIDVYDDVQLAPRPSGLRAVLPKQPFGGAAELQPRAVDQQVHGTGARPRAGHVQAFGSATEHYQPLSAMCSGAARSRPSRVIMEPICLRSAAAPGGTPTAVSAPSRWPPGPKSATAQCMSRRQQPRKS